MAGKRPWKRIFDQNFKTLQSYKILHKINMKI